MKKIVSSLLILVFSVSFAQVSWQGGTTPESNQSATILFDKTGTGLAAYTGTIYAHTGVTLNGTAWSNVIGSWNNNVTQPALTFVGGSTYSLTLSPTIMQKYAVTSGSITKINIVFRSANTSGTTNYQSVDLTLNVGAYQSTLISPLENSNTIISSGQNLSISANNTNGSASYNLLANGLSINTASGATFAYTDSNITSNKSYELQITQGITTFSKKFGVIINPGTTNLAMASGLEDGINYNASDPTKATVVLTAPGKDFVYVAGSFNNWVPDSSYAMKKDPSGKFWLELTGLTSGTQYSYQYWVVDQTPTIGSQTIIKCADPFSTLVLSPYDDSGISAISYPNMPIYPSGQQFEVTVLQTGQTTYPWSTATTGFIKPSKDNLVVYEVLIRDFDANRNFQTLIDRIDYFKNLKINAIELMPVMEYEGNEGWGYNPAFHLALDKYYGTKVKMKEFVDLCHQNGIAVILDVALNHAFGRNPMVRMWQNDPTNSGYGAPASDNPYFNTTAKHSYSVGNDFNHASAYTKYYTKRVVKQWVNEFKIDGFRWDLTKGFTQLCSSGDDACTNGSPSDRVAILKDYADYSWSLDPNHYVIFEHLGTDSEEQQWANYRISGDSDGISKGVMMWGEFTYPYTQLIEGYASGADISRMGAFAHGFNAKRLIGYPESHDKERLMYSAITYGNGSGTSPIAGNLNNALGRMSAIGAVSLLIPGPKMIWHFADLGMQNSIYDCNNGTVNTETDATTGDCKLNTKPQPQWVGNWLGVSQRVKIYNDWAKMIDLKKNNVVFNGNYSISTNGSNLKQRVYVYDNSLLTTQLKNVVILANFDTSSQSIEPNFPYTGTWVNLMDNSTIGVTSTTINPINIEAGGFRIYGNQPAVLSTEEFGPINNLSLTPNPASTYFTLNGNVQRVQIYSITGQLVKSLISNFTNESQFDISDLNKGIYFVKVKDNNNREATLKLVKQ